MKKCDIFIRPLFYRLPRAVQDPENLINSAFTNCRFERTFGKLQLIKTHIRINQNYKGSVRQIKNVIKKQHTNINTHEKKLEDLSHNSILPYKDEETITNLSSYNLSFIFIYI